MSGINYPEGGGGGGSDGASAVSGVAFPSDWSFTSGDFTTDVVYGVGEALEMTRPSDYSSPASPTDSDAGTLRDVHNNSRFGSAAIASGHLTITTSTSSSAWNHTTRNAPGIYSTHEKPTTPDCALVSIAKIEFISGPNASGVALNTYQISDTSHYARIGIHKVSGSSYNVASRIGADSADVTASLGNVTELAVACLLMGKTFYTFYNTNADAGPTDSGWTYLDAKTEGDYSAMRCRVGCLVYTPSSTAAEGRIHSLKCYALPRSKWPILANTWVGDAMQRLPYHTTEVASGSAVTATVQIPLASSVTLSNDRLRRCLIDACKHGTDGITFRASRGGAPTGTYAAPGAVTLESSNGEDLYLHVQMNAQSDGSRPPLIGVVRLVGGA